MIYHMEFGGGLGDIIDQLHREGTYNVLRDLEPHDAAVVYLITHNPFAAELFSHHPKRAQITVVECGYWPPDQDNYQRDERGMPPAGMNWRLPLREGPVEFHPSAASRERLAALPPGQYLVLAAGAGMGERVMPHDVYDRILTSLQAHTNMPVVCVGRTYERDGRWEPMPPDVPGVLNYIDQLDVPGSCAVVRGAAGLITAHSSLLLLAWRYQLPVLFTYPPSVLERHLGPDGNPDQWLRGIRSPLTHHTLFDDMTTADVMHFLSIVRTNHA